MTMVPAENLSKQHHLPQGTGGGGGFYGFNCGLMSSVHGYYYQNEANSMAEDEEGSVMNRKYQHVAEAKYGCHVLIIDSITGGFEAGISKVGQTRKHVLLAFSIGVKQMIYCCNKMDATILNYSKASFEALYSDNIRKNVAVEDLKRDHVFEIITGSSSKDNNDQEQEERDKSWLQLSIGTQTQATRTYDEYDRNKHEQGDPASWRRGSALTELDLLPGGGSQSQQARPLSPIFHMPEFRPPPPHHGALAPYFGRPFLVQSTDVAGPSSEVRIIDPPRRPHSGIWFMLQASRNQSKEPFLPQIPKSYLRIKDGKMTVRLIMKYLANKLRLDSESEVLF
ncbi:hypothetical protein V6N11_011696 [Hibiscus sabdariffa]|uniref:Tr-type G domain-containing protein n=1 Tax=Hibiscus sabdariffa TaxID=183260 RepID=A0ABR2S997_9ROSI